MTYFLSKTLAIVLYLATYVKHGLSIEFSTDGMECGDLFLTVSAIQKASIEVNWKFTCKDTPNKIRLYSSDPRKEGAKTLLALRTSVNEGHYVTSISLESPLPSSWDKTGDPLPVLGHQCLNYWVSSFRNNSTIVQTNCLKIQPTWMETHGDRIGDVPLGKLFIPGTHNSGCYDNGSGYNALNKYVITQDRDIWTQLVYGIRYLDIRVGYYNSTLAKNTFWVNHDIFKVSQLIPILREIKNFLSWARKEVVILDLHRFPVGFKTHERDRHRQLVDLLHREVGDIAIPRQYQKRHGPTLREIWKQKRRLIVCYGDEKTSDGSNWLWDPLMQYWGDQQTTNGLKQYLNSIKNEAKITKNPLWAAMAELTPSPALVFLGILSSKTSLAHLADEVNRNVTEWYRNDLSHNVNIVATDYFLGNDIIEISIRVNLKKSVLAHDYN